MKSFANYLALIALLILSHHEAAEGQAITTACSASTAMSFTPCINFITGSSANGGTPTAQCCDAVKSIMTDSVQCACLILTGNVPFSIPFSQPLAISLPRLCKTGVPVRCQASGVPVPAAGPAIFVPSPAPSAYSPTGQRVGKATDVAAPPPIAASPEETVSPAASPDTETEAESPSSRPSTSLRPEVNPSRPVINPNSSAALSRSLCPPPLILLFALLATLVVLNATETHPFRDIYF